MALSTEVIHRLEVASDNSLSATQAECMNLDGLRLDEVLAERECVLSTSQALRFMTENQLRWRIRSGRWQQPARGVVVAQSGPLTDGQLLRVALLRAGPRATLAGLTAARLDGLKGFDDKPPMNETPIYLLVPVGYKRHTPPLG
jgi:hypothetical protein